MRNLITGTLVLLGAAAPLFSSASAASFGPAATVGLGNVLKSPIIMVHSRQEVHDMLHSYGYEHVVYKSRYYDGGDKPIYRYRACQGRRAYLLDVNWYGHIIDRSGAGRCHRYDW